MNATDNLVGLNMIQLADKVTSGISVDASKYKAFIFIYWLGGSAGYSSLCPIRIGERYRVGNYASYADLTLSSSSISVSIQNGTYSNGSVSIYGVV